jgi:hypothetical protein
MSIVLPALAVAFAAFCVWLGVRIINRRERWAKWTLAGLMVNVPLLYVSGFCVACWLGSANPDADGFRCAPAPWLFWPMGRAKIKSPHVFKRAICRLATLYGEPVGIPVTPDGEALTLCNPH